MVKKISGNKPPSSGPSAIEPTKPVEASKVSDVGQVKGAERQSATGSVQGRDVPLTAAEREKLYQLISEEAEKMFGDGRIPEGKRKTVERAVQMAIDATIIDEEDAE